MTKKILSLFIASSLILGMFSTSFAEGSKAPEDKINKLIDLKVIKGYKDGTLKLESPITRGEFGFILASTMIDNSKYIENFRGYSYFSDVKEDSWMSPYLNYLFQQSVVKGYSDNSYRPNNNITFTEAIVMIVRSLDVEVKVGKSWSESHIETAKELGILEGVDISDYSKVADRHKVFEMIYNKIEWKI